MLIMKLVLFKRENRYFNVNVFNRYSRTKNIETLTVKNQRFFKHLLKNLQALQ
jgi:hypothetical protein